MIRIARRSLIRLPPIRRKELPSLLHRCRSLSARWLSASPDVDSEMMVLGAHKWSQMEPAKYQHIVQTALSQGITTLEVGVENAGGDGHSGPEAALLQALTSIPVASSKPITVLKKVGYRTITAKTVTKLDNDAVGEFDAAKPDVLSTSFCPLDIHVEDLPSSPSSDTAKVVHNMGKDYLQLVLSNSLLTSSEDADIQVVPLLHNPEVQTMLLTTTEPSQRQDRIRERLASAMVALEAQCDDDQGHNNVQSYGICSNGLCLPESHPLHVSASTVIAAAQQASNEIGGKALRLSVIQLPANALETTGFLVAADLKQLAEASGVLPLLQLHCQRPLTCYPDAGTGTGNPFVLADYQLPASMEKTLSWTNTMTRPPEVYYVALQTAMAHFDAEELIQLKQAGEELSTEQRETLDGCKLLQSLLHDVDHGLDQLRSFRAHETELYERVIPLIHDTFESYDDETARVLQSFFAAYSLAVRHAIARNTRKLLVQGEADSSNSDGGGAIPLYPDLAPEMRLHEFGLRRVLEPDVFDKIVIGCTEPDQMVDNLDIVRNFNRDER